MGVPQTWINEYFRLASCCLLQYQFPRYTRIYVYKYFTFGVSKAVVCILLHFREEVPGAMELVGLRGAAERVNYVLHV